MTDQILTRPKPHIRSSADPTVLRIIPELATEIGLNESIMLLQIAFWIQTSNNYYDGHWWTYQSVRDMHEKAFGYWSISTINRIAKKLISEGYLIEGNYNQQKYDNTRWFALNTAKLQTLASLTVVDETGYLYPHTLSQNDTGVFQNDTRSTQNDTRSAQNETTIPETPTETPTEIKTEKDSLLRKDTLPDYMKLLIFSELLRHGSDKSNAQDGEAKSAAVQEESDQPQQSDNLALENKKESSAAGVSPPAGENDVLPASAPESARDLNDQYQEVVRRALGAPGEPKQPGAWVQRYVKFLRGQWQEGEKGAGQKTLEHQLEDQPMSPAEIAGLTLWYRKEYDQPKIPTSYDVLRQRCDEFRALNDVQTWIAEGQRRIDAIMNNKDTEQLEAPDTGRVWPKVDYYNVPRPEIVQGDWSEFRQKLRERRAAEEQANEQQAATV